MSNYLRIINLTYIFLLAAFTMTMCYPRQIAAFLLVLHLCSCYL